MVAKAHVGDAYQVTVESPLAYPGLARPYQKNCSPLRIERKRDSPFTVGKRKPHPLVPKSSDTLGMKKNIRSKSASN